MSRLTATAIFILVGLGLLAASVSWILPHTAGAAATSTSGCVSYWYVSYGGTGSYTLINTDPDGLAITDLRFSRSYSDPTDLSRGYLDFNRDGKSDIFSAVPTGNGDYQWRYSSGGTSAWINLAHDTTPPDQLRFGDFDGDGFTDVFSVILSNGQYQWRYSSGGASSWINLARDTTPLDQLRFGDFNGDGRTDIFVLTDLGNGSYGWNVSYGGTSNYQQINSAPTLLSDMQFGDINGDGHTDVFTSVPDNNNPGSYNWYYSSAGSGAYVNFVNTNLSVHDVQLAGDFNKDHRSDWFFTTVRPDGNYQWWYFYYEPLPIGSTQLAFDNTPPDQLRFGDFNGDGITDVFKLVRQCTSSPTPSPSPTPTATPSATPTATPTAAPGRLGNISTRLQVGTGNNVLFAGFIIQGNASKTVIIRSIGPSLTGFGVPGAMSNPRLELHDANNTIGTNDNWQTTQIGGVITSDQVAAIQNSGLKPNDPAEPAIIATLPAGQYSAIVQGVNNTQGVATVEVYDLTPGNGTTLANISTRGFIQTGDNVMIGGFILVGQASKVVVRAIGPSLTQFGINNALTNPRLELHDTNGTLAMNDDWQTTQLGGIITADQSAAIQNSGLAPSNPAESAIIATLAPGNYTAIAQGVNGGIGVGLIEVFAVP